MKWLKIPVDFELQERVSRQAQTSSESMPTKGTSKTNIYLMGFNPSEKNISQIGSFPQVGKKTKHL